MYLQMPTDLIATARRWTACELLVWMDVHTMQVAGMTYYRTNQAMADLLHTDVRQVRRAIQQLTQCGALTTTMDGRQRVLTARLPKEDKSDRGQICPGTNLVAKEDKFGREGGQIWSLGEDKSVLQVMNISKEVSIEESNTKRAPAHIRARAREEVVMPFEDDDFKNAWAVWIQDRAERRLKRYTQRGEQAALHNLHTISGGDPHTAVAIIHQSIQHSWHGLFQLKSANQRGRADDKRPRGQAATADDIMRLVATKRY
jgi:hypothetical protein